MLQGRVSSSSRHATGALLGSVAALGVAILVPPLGAFTMVGVFGSIALFIRGGTQLTTRKYASRALREHDAKYALPVARVHRLPAET
jgi:hypothetical protein